MQNSPSIVRTLARHIIKSGLPKGDTPFEFRRMDYDGSDSHPVLPPAGVLEGPLPKPPSIGLTSNQAQLSLVAPRAQATQSAPSAVAPLWTRRWNRGIDSVYIPAYVRQYVGPRFKYARRWVGTRERMDVPMMTPTTDAIPFCRAVDRVGPDGIRNTDRPVCETLHAHRRQRGWAANVLMRPAAVGHPRAVLGRTPVTTVLGRPELFAIVVE